MFTAIADFVEYLDGVHQRTCRDVQALPPRASGWAPAVGQGESAWTVNQLIGHIVVTRGYFVRAYRGEGWRSPDEPDTSDPAAWPLLVEASADQVRASLLGTPDAWLRRQVPRMGSDELIAGWRVLMMMIEHEVHHRSQLDTYAGLNGWHPPQIFGRQWEQVLELQAEERAREAAASSGEANIGR